nr:sensor histidine kinase [Rhizobium sp. L1K21]
MGASYILYDDKERAICITGLPERWRGNIGQSPSDEVIFGNDLAQQLKSMRQGLQKAGDQGLIEYEFDDGCIFQFKCRRLYIPDQGLYFILSVADKTEERQREILLQTLLLEVSHRSKNMLAIVQGLASQTARYCVSLDEFLIKFRGRIQALSKSQDLITDTDWRGVHFYDLVATQTERFTRTHSLTFETTGTNALLPPNTAINIGLAFHELAANAVAHHDLSKGPGKVIVNCSQVEENGIMKWEIIWQEDFAKAALPDENSGESRFGAIILEKVVPTSIAGTAKLDLDQNARYVLTFPVGITD